MILRTPYDALPAPLVAELADAGLDPRAVYDHVALAFEEDLPGGVDDVTSDAMPDEGLSGSTSVSGPGQKAAASVSARASNAASFFAAARSRTWTIRGLKLGRPLLA